MRQSRTPWGHRSLPTHQGSFGLLALMYVLAPSTSMSDAELPNQAEGAFHS